MSIKRSNEEKLDLFADIIEPAYAVISDREWAQKWQDGDRAGAIRTAVKNHKPEIVEILARVEGVEPGAYEIDGLALFMKLVTMFNRPDIDVANGLFTQQGQNDESAYSGSATVNTGDGAQ